MAVRAVDDRTCNNHETDASDTDTRDSSTILRKGEGYVYQVQEIQYARGCPLQFNGKVVSTIPWLAILLTKSEAIK